MRSMTFDMVGMALMALGVIFTCGVMLMWGYVRSTRGPRKQDAVPTGTAKARSDHVDAVSSAKSAASSPVAAAGHDEATSDRSSASEVLVGRR
jgi:hypothetical protein